MDTQTFKNLEVRLAKTDAELDAAQALRYRIFYEEMGAKPTPHCFRLKRDVDPYDEICDHMLVIDLEKSGPGETCVVGTYRLLRGAVAEGSAGFYSEDEFDLKNLLQAPGEVMELGRSCIDSRYRRRGAMQLLWRGIADYITEHQVRFMFGCGSIHGTDTEDAKRVLSYLYHYHLAPRNLCPVALDYRFIDMNMMAKDQIDETRAQAEMPPLLKGYLRLGGWVGQGAVIDHQFNTIDVCVVVETEKVTGKYSRHFIKPRPDEAAIYPVLAAE